MQRLKAMGEDFVEVCRDAPALSICLTKRNRLMTFPHEG